MTTTFLDLNAISSEFSEKRQILRMTLTREQFRLNETTKLYGLHDLSEKGMAIRVLETSDQEFFVIGKKVDGVLKLGDLKLPVIGMVKNIRPETIGIEFGELTEKSRDSIARFVSPERLGQEIRALPHLEGGAIWYHGQAGTDLWVWRKWDGTYHRFCLYLYGICIEWTEESGLVTGKTDLTQDPRLDHGVMQIETYRLIRDAAVDFSKREVAKRFFSGSILPEDLKKWCLRRV